MAKYLTASLPGIGGSIRQQDEDFLVEEIPLYEPCGQGDHLYLWIEKRGLTTYDLLHNLARALKCKERDLGYAGLKDARAITRQMISVPLRKPEDVRGLDLPGVQILSARLHTNKLRPGHLAGNRFRIRIADCCSDASTRADAILGVLSDLGVPNRFGQQRYGLLDNSHLAGRAILRGEFELAVRVIMGDPDQIRHPGWQQGVIAYRSGNLEEAIRLLPRHCRNERNLLLAMKSGKEPGNAVMAMPRKLLRLYLSAYQSSLFDRLVDMRLATIERLWLGDLAYKHDNGACFLVTDPAVEQPRADRLEISPSAPLFGCKVRLAENQAGLLEQSLLDKEGLNPASFRLSGGLTMDGERRPLRVPLSNVTVEEETKGLLIGFDLPKGSFATAVLAEVMKTDQTSGLGSSTAMV